MKMKMTLALVALAMLIATPAWAGGDAEAFVVRGGTVRCVMPKVPTGYYVGAEGKPLNHCVSLPPEHYTAGGYQEGADNGAIPCAFAPGVTKIDFASLPDRWAVANDMVSEIEPPVGWNQCLHRESGYLCTANTPAGSVEEIRYAGPFPYATLDDIVCEGADEGAEYLMMPVGQGKVTTWEIDVKMPLPGLPPSLAAVATYNYDFEIGGNNGANEGGCWEMIEGATDWDAWLDTSGGESHGNKLKWNGGSFGAIPKFKLAQMPSSGSFRVQGGDLIQRKDAATSLQVGDQCTESSIGSELVLCRATLDAQGVRRWVRVPYYADGIEASHPPVYGNGDPPFFFDDHPGQVDNGSAIFATGPSRNLSAVRFRMKDTQQWQDATDLNLIDVGGLSKNDLTDCTELNTNIPSGRWNVPILTPPFHQVYDGE